MKIWVGELVREAVFNKSEQHISMSKLAELLSVSRTQLYNIVNNPMMSPVYAIRIGSIIGVDFSKSIKELEKYNSPLVTNVDPTEQTVYLSLKDEVSDLQKKLITLYENNESLRSQLSDCKSLLQDKK